MARRRHHRRKHRVHHRRRNPSGEEIVVLLVGAVGGALATALYFNAIAKSSTTMGALPAAAHGQPTV